MLAGVLVSVGHDYPVVLGFRGGKGILCGLGWPLWRTGGLPLLVLGFLALRCSSPDMCPWAPAWRRWLWASASGCSMGTALGWWQRQW